MTSDFIMEPPLSPLEVTEVFSWDLNSSLDTIEPFTVPSVYQDDPNDDDDDEDGEADTNSLSSHHTHASMFQQKGAIRKAGWLHVKSMLVQRKKRVERPGKRSWKKYWGKSL